MDIVIATRGSALALWQANHIKDLIEKEHGLKVGLNVIKTTGDKILDVPLAKIGGKGLFVKEIEQALYDKKADLAVHSMKDVPSELPEGLEIYANPAKHVPNDAFLSVKYGSIDELPTGAVVGTSSLRRRLQLLKIKPDVVTKDLRGNVDTRIRKMVEGDYDAVILAEAGLRRLGLTEHIKQSVPVDLMIPAVCQGVLGIEVRSDDSKIKKILEFLKDRDTELTVAAERAFLQRLEGGCQAPIACHAVLNDGKINVKGYLASVDGKISIIEVVEGDYKEATDLGKTLADKILNSGGREILEKIYN